MDQENRDKKTKMWTWILGIGIGLLFITNVIILIWYFSSKATKTDTVEKISKSEPQPIIEKPEGEKEKAKDDETDPAKLKITPGPTPELTPKPQEEPKPEPKPAYKTPRKKDMGDVSVPGFKQVLRSYDEHDWYKHPFFTVADPKLEIDAQKKRGRLCGDVEFDIKPEENAKPIIIEWKDSQSYLTDSSLRFSETRKWFVNDEQTHLQILANFPNIWQKMLATEKKRSPTRSYDSYCNAILQFNCFLYNFYRNEIIYAGRGKWLSWYLLYDEEDGKEWELHHDYIQVIFPNAQFSIHQFDKVIMPNVAELLYKQNPRQFCVFLRCLAFNYARFLVDYQKFTLKNTPIYEKTHNDERMSRVIFCLRYFGEYELANKFFDFISTHCRVNENKKTELGFWKLYVDLKKADFIKDADIDLSLKTMK